MANFMIDVREVKFLFLAAAPLKIGRNSYGWRFLCFFLLIGFDSGAYSAQMEFEVYKGTPNCRECTLIRADGDIAESTASELEEFLANNEEISNRDTTLVLNSPGGALISALEIGELLRSRGISTHIARIDFGDNSEISLSEGICASSCAYAFLGGERRSIGQLSKYGLHQVSTTSEASIPLRQAVRTTQEIVGQVSQYVERMGASSEIVTIATRISDSSIYWVSQDELLALGVVNSDGLVQQRPWARVAQSTSWSIESVLTDGSIDLLIMSCNEVPSALNVAGHIRVSLRQSRGLPAGHWLIGGIATFPTQVLLNGNSVLEERAQQYSFNQGGHSTYSLQIPSSAILRSVVESEPLRIKVAYSEDVSEYMSEQVHPIPTDGLDIAFEALSRSCPHLTM